MNNKDKHVAFRINRETYEKAKAKTDYEGRPLSVVLRAALEAYIREGVTYEDLRDLGKQSETTTPHWSALPHTITRTTTSGE